MPTPYQVAFRRFRRSNDPSDAPDVLTGEIELEWDMECGPEYSEEQSVIVELNTDLLDPVVSVRFDRDDSERDEKLAQILRADKRAVEVLVGMAEERFHQDAMEYVPDEGCYF